uniref:High cysteine membrane protein n=1 Tax=Macrostomum lignano TaxID=282301 RepID=A0A1I8GNK6_9PLAT
MKSAGLLESALAWTLLLTVIATAAGLECHDQESTNHTIKCSDHQKTCARSYFSDGKFMGASCGGCTKFHFAALSVGLTAFCKTCSDDKCNSAKLTNGLSFSPQFSCSVGSNLIVLCNTGVSVCFRAKYSNGRTISGCGECAGIMAEALKEKKAVACKTCSTAKCNTEVLLTVEAPTPKTECQPSAAVDPKIPAKCVYFQNEHSDEKTIVATCGDCVSFSKYADKALISTTCQSCTADTCAAEPSMAKVEPAAKGLKCFVSFDQKSKVKTLAMCKAGVRQCHRAESKSGRAVFIAACGNCEPFNSHIKGAAEGVTCKACGTERCNSAQPPEKAATEGIECNINFGTGASTTVKCGATVRSCFRAELKDGKEFASCGDCNGATALFGRIGNLVRCDACFTDRCGSMQAAAGPAPVLTCYAHSNTAAKIEQSCPGFNKCYLAIYGSGAESGNCGDCSLIESAAKLTGQTIKCSTCSTDKCNAGSSTGAIGAG